MTATPMLIVVPTFQRCDLLDRMLGSLSRCRIPAGVRAVVVAENGARAGAEAVSAKYRDRLPIRYHYTEPPGKNRAFNELLHGATDEFVIFFDDDIRVHPETLGAYASAAGTRGGGLFIGGRCRVDYTDGPPPAWLQPYLPPSARGWGLGEEPCRLDVPDALGFNWGAFASDLKAAGGFDERLGPGTAILGDETDMQKRLLARGVEGLYLPAAQVWHLVPRERCSPEWLQERAVRMGAAQGVTIAGRGLLQRSRQSVRCRVRIVLHRLRLAAFRGRMSPEELFRHSFSIRSFGGILNGMRAERRAQRLTR